MLTKLCIVRLENASNIASSLILKSFFISSTFKLLFLWLSKYTKIRNSFKDIFLSKARTKEELIINFSSVKRVKYLFIMVPPFIILKIFN